jgi:hypothetical protein
MAAPPSGGEDDSDDEWKISVDEVGPPAHKEPDEPDSPQESDGNVAGTLQRNQPLEPGDIDPENAAFVILGVLIVAVLLIGAIVGF